jgi:hypothetical protein
LLVQKLRNQAKQAEAIEAKKKHMQAFVDKFRYNAKRASLVQSRIKAIDRLGEVQLMDRDPEYVFNFPFPDVCSFLLACVTSATLRGTWQDFHCGFVSLFDSFTSRRSTWLDGHSSLGLFSEEFGPSLDYAQMLFILQVALLIRYVLYRACVSGHSWAACFISIVCQRVVEHERRLVAARCDDLEFSLN